jgi:hypothetical protein
MSRTSNRLTPRHRDLLRRAAVRAAEASVGVEVSPVDLMCLLDDAGELDGAEADGTKSPLENAIDLIWRDVVLSRKPNYGDWDYGGMAFRHVVAEVREIEAERDAALAEVARLKAERTGTPEVQP